MTIFSKFLTTPRQSMNTSALDCDLKITFLISLNPIERTYIDWIQKDLRSSLLESDF
ncbi:MAG: hypothetical protein LH631_10300 [Alkalinema sp. CAN_BIN05]|nr:hypothetical protein [Alkalinema sp. CAN_BIN05]